MDSKFVFADKVDCGSQMKTDPNKMELDFVDSATNLVKGNHSVIVASRDLEKAKSLSNKIGSLATAKEASAAIKEADVIIPAIYFNSLKEFFRTYALALEGKIVVDVSNPIAPDGNGGFKKIVGEHESADQILSNLIPKSAKHRPVYTN